MTLEQIIEARIQAESINIFTLHPFQLITIGLALIGLFLYYRFLDKKVEEKRERGLNSKLVYLFPTVSMGVVAMIIWFAMIIISSLYNLGENYEEWEEEYLKPYINSLETHRTLVESVNYIDDSTTTIAYFEGDKLIRKKDTFKIEVAPKGVETPYLEYKILEQDLSHDYKTGMVDVVLYIPRKYEVDKQMSN